MTFIKAGCHLIRISEIACISEGRAYLGNYIDVRLKNSHKLLFVENQTGYDDVKLLMRQLQYKEKQEGGELGFINGT